MKNTMDGIEEYPNIFDQYYCNTVIDMFETMYRNNQTYIQNNIRKNSDDRVMFEWSNGNTITHHDPVIIEPFYKKLNEVYENEYMEKYNILTTAAPHTPKGMGIQRTGPHQGYHAWHAESADISTCARVIAYTLYLNDVEEGGETEFLYQGVKIKPEQGKLSFFPGGFMYPHRGNPIYKGYKYIITGWYTYDQ